MIHDAPPRRPRGRPADPNVDTALRVAAFEVLAEYGWRGTTVERIAERSGVSRTTIYRRHGSVHGVLRLMMGEGGTKPADIDTGSLRGDLVTIMQRIVRAWREPQHVEYVNALMAAQRENAELGEAYRAHHKQRHDRTMRVVQRGVQRGEIRGDADLGLLIDLLAGVITQRVLASDPRLDDDFAAEVVDCVLDGFAPR